MDDMKKMMGNMMSSAMPSMMDKMFQAMPADQRVEFVTTMMPRCLTMVLDSLDQPGRERMARDVINSFTRLAEHYLSPDPASSRSEPAAAGESEVHTTTTLGETPTGTTDSP